MFGRNKDCNHCVTKIDMLQAGGAILMALWKALSLYRDYHKNQEDEEAKHELKRLYGINYKEG